jgi:hypothetical protein
MSEAFGRVILKTGTALDEELIAGRYGTRWETMEQVFAGAGLVLKGMDASVDVFEDENFGHEGAESRDGYVCIDSFGDPWMKIMAALVTKGRNIEAYGHIQHEHGYDEYYALNPDGDRFFEGIDPNAASEIEQRELRQKWLECVPESVSDLLAEDGEE